MCCPAALIKYRETGILRRLSVTPVPPSWLLAAQIVINLAIVVAGFIMLTVAGVAAFGLALPKNFLGFLLADLTHYNFFVRRGTLHRRDGQK